jgi:hypothetical protein
MYSPLNDRKNTRREFVCNSSFGAFSNNVIDRVYRALMAKWGDSLKPNPRSQEKSFLLKYWDKTSRLASSGLK